MAILAQGLLSFVIFCVPSSRSYCSDGAVDAAAPLVSAIMRCFSTALGAGPCRRLGGVRDEQFALFCGAHHPPRENMVCRPGANVELGLLLAMVRHGSRRQSQLDSASEPLERKCVVDVHWSPEHNSNSRSYTVQAGQTLHGALVCRAADDSYTLSLTVVETGETSSQVVQCQSGKMFVVPYVVRCLREGVLFLHVPWRWQGQLPKHYCRVRRHGRHASPAYTTPGFWKNVRVRLLC